MVVLSYERSKALLEKTKYALASSELKKNEDYLTMQKDQKAFARKKIEDHKVDLVKKKLEKTKQ